MPGVSPEVQHQVSQRSRLSRCQADLLLGNTDAVAVVAAEQKEDNDKDQSSIMSQLQCICKSTACDQKLLLAT